MTSLARRVLLYGSALLIAGTLAMVGQRGPSLDADALETRVMTAMRERRYEDARGEISELDQRFPRDPRGPLLAGFLSEILSEDLEIVVAHYRRALPRCDSDERRGVVMAAIADLQRRQGRLELCAETLSESLVRFGDTPRFAEVDLLLALDRGDGRLATRALERLESLHPNHVRLPGLRRRVEDLLRPTPSRPLERHPETSEPGFR